MKGFVMGDKNQHIVYYKYITENMSTELDHSPKLLHNIKPKSF